MWLYIENLFMLLLFSMWLLTFDCFTQISPCWYTSLNIRKPSNFSLDGNHMLHVGSLIFLGLCMIPVAQWLASWWMAQQPFREWALQLTTSADPFFYSGKPKAMCQTRNLTLYKVSWCIIMYNDVSWCIMMYNDVSWSHIVGSHSHLRWR